MKKLHVLLFSLIVAVLLVGCGNAGGGKITKENFDKIKEGMTKAEVVAILGEPTGTEMVGQINDQEIRAPIWKADGIKIVAGFGDDGKLTAKRLDNE